MQQPALTAGLYRQESADGGAYTHLLQKLWQENLAHGYNFTVITVSKDLPAPQASLLDLPAYQALPQPAFTRKSHSELPNKEWLSFGGRVANVPAAGLEDDVVTLILTEATQWAKYLGMHSISLDLGRLLDAGHSQGQSLHFYAELIARLMHKTVYEGFQFWIKVPWHNAGWELWNELRRSIGENAKNRLHVMVDLKGCKESASGWNAEMARWFGESVQAVSLPTSEYDSGPEGLALSPPLQEICSHFFHYLDIKWLLEGPCFDGQSYSAYRTILENIRQSSPLSELDLFLRGSTDCLQRPMQPLQDQLHSANYALFEKDPVKYVQYEKAIRKALVERHPGESTVTLMVLGAGRGPLVDAALRAANGLPCKLKIFVIEKNPTAVVTLKHRAADDWTDQDVTIVETNMRDWAGDDKADIIVSELLGSWGDNELSPECLDGAQHLLKEDGISIPSSYTSYISPITTARLHAYTGGQAPFLFPDIGNRKFYETTYVVLMGSVFRLADEQACFTFDHPNPGMSSNERQATCSFTMPKELSQCELHGFRGTFDCTLYDDIHISIADQNYSEGMFTWFPLYIPLQHPVTLAGGEQIEVMVWRRLSSTRVWYEWSVRGKTHIHNYGGRSSDIGLY